MGGIACSPLRDVVGDVCANLGGVITDNETCERVANEYGCTAEAPDAGDLRMVCYRKVVGGNEM